MREVNRIYGRLARESEEYAEALWLLHGEWGGYSVSELSRRVRIVARSLPISAAQVALEAYAGSVYHRRLIREAKAEEGSDT